jgi:Na+/H+-dicarboxylate symporter
MAGAMTSFENGGHYEKPHIFLVSGALFYVAALILAFLTNVHSAPAVALRVFGLALLAVSALWRRSLTAWILWSMLAGVEAGLDAPFYAIHLRVLSDIFLRLIKTIVAPLILGTLISGIAGHGSLKDIGRLGIKSLVYFEILTTIALIVGLCAINVSQAGVGIHPIGKIPLQNEGMSIAAQQPYPLKWDQFLLHIVPENLAKSVAEDEILQVVVFALLFGIAMTRLSEETRRPLLTVIEAFTKAMFQFTNLIMYLSPLAVGGALAYTVAHAGAGVIASLSKLVLTLYVALAAFVLLGMLPAALLARVPLRRFLSAVAEPAMIAFSTSTSEAALPIAMEQMEALGVPRKIVAFVLPTGYSFNLAGSAIYLALASVFVAQAGGIRTGLKAQLGMLLALMLTSKGVAGVPRAVLVVLMATAASFNLPLEPIVLILGVDALMDMGRTTINVVGNCLASVVIARWEREFHLSAVEGTRVSLQPSSAEDVLSGRTIER